MLPLVHNSRNRVDVKAFATLEQRLFCVVFLTIDSRARGGELERKLEASYTRRINKGTVIPAKWTKAYFLFCLGFLRLQAVTRRFFCWLKGLKRSHGPTSRRGEAGRGERERRRVLETWISRRKIDYENRFQELEKELSKRLLLVFFHIREM